MAGKYVEDAAVKEIFKLIKDNYAKQDGAYENIWAGNLITDQNWSWVNDFQFGTGTVDTVFDGEATIRRIKGKTTWDGTTPHYANVVSNTSVLFNLYNPSLHYAHVVESDDENNGLCIWSKELEDAQLVQVVFSRTTDFSSPEYIMAYRDTNSTGESYLHATVPEDGYVKIRHDGEIFEPNDLCISNVWGGNRVTHHPAYSADIVNIGTSDYFATGMKSITVNGETTVYDEMLADKYFARVLAYSFGALPTVSYVTASGSYNIYRLSLANAMNKGACEIGGSTKFTWLDVGAMSSSTALSADSMSLASGYIYFGIAQSEDTTYTYAQDDNIVDAETFASELAAKGALYTYSGGVYTSVTEYTEGTTYYYISETNLHGLNGKAINDEIANKIINYQRYSMDKSTYAGTAISPAKNWTYAMGDFGTEELTLGTDSSIPDWEVYYPINVLETVQKLPDNYMSKASAENLLHQVGDLQGFDFNGISKDSETGNWQIDGLVDTKETIIKIDTALVFQSNKDNTDKFTPEQRKIIHALAAKHRDFYLNMPQATGGRSIIRCIYAGKVFADSLSSPNEDMYIMCGNYYGKGKYTLWVRNVNKIEIQQ